MSAADTIASVGWKHTALSAVRRLGGFRLLETVYGSSRLTVLAYHRVTDPDAAGFMGFRGNVSATPAEFDEQMAWVAAEMTPVAIDAVVDAVGGRPLPNRAVLVTFDDGYRDNLTTAAPILDRHRIPATIFLATDHIGTATPFWWDHVAWCFTASPIEEAELPILGPRSWQRGAGPVSEWVAAAKTLPEVEKQQAVASLAGVLGAGDPSAAFAGQLLDWDDVRFLAGRGWRIGGHTCTHPILTKVDPSTATAEVVDSVERVRTEVGSDVPGFAYPNGQPGDFDGPARAAVTAAGVPLAFTLVPGPTRPSEVLRDPLAIRRVYVHHGDDSVRFGAKVAGLPRLMGRG